MQLRRAFLATVLAAGVLLPATIFAAPAGAYTPRPLSVPPRVLLLGDSIMDQMGSAADFLLHQEAGIVSKHEGEWGSGLLTTDQYDYGKTKLGGYWLKKAADYIATFDPDIVAVYLNHNYWPPHPHDAAGTVINDLWAANGQTMIRRQATAFIKILRSRGAQVYFVSPIPMVTSGNGDPNVTNPIWHGYISVLPSLGVPVINAGAALTGPNHTGVESKPNCTGTQTRVRPTGDLHLTRFGAGLTGTLLANALAGAAHVSLHGNVAPGDHTVALVPTPTGNGYWLVGCDGSIYHFGAAANLNGVRSAVAGHHGVTAAVATATGLGMWLVTADGTIAHTGDATALAFTARPSSPIITDAAGTADRQGIWAAAGNGAVYVAGTAHNYGSMAGKPLSGYIFGIEATHTGKGYTLAGVDGGVFGFGDAHFYGSAVGKSKFPVMALARTPDDRGYWTVGSDGGIFVFGDAHYYGNGLFTPPSPPLTTITPNPGAAVDVIGAPAAAQGYWTVNDNGRVTNHGAAAGHAGDNNLALFTQ